jgi:membrane-bound lytic murein transglycosylase B
VATPAASSASPTSATAATAGVQSAAAQLAGAQDEVRTATQRAEQLAYTVVALHDQQADAEVAVTAARAQARQAIREAYDNATIDPTADLYAALSGADADLATRVRDRRMGDAAARAGHLQQALSRLTALSGAIATRRTAANKAAAQAVSAADKARQQLTIAEQTEREAQRQAELAAQRKELDRRSRELAQSLAAVDAASRGSSGGELTADSPASLRVLYTRAATTCPGLPWGVLAGIGQVETDHGRNKAVSSAGAMGPMQFMPSTFAVYGVDGDGDGKADILDQADAVYSAAHYLCASGGGKSDTLYDAIFAYNHSDSYVNIVLGLAAQYH